MKRTNQTTICILLSLALATGSAYAQPATSPSAVCPSLTDAGERMPLAGKVTEKSLKLKPLTLPPPADIAGPARAVVMRFEGGGTDPYTNISGRDGISIGMSQWNHGSGSLYSTLLKAADATDIDLAPERIRADLKILDAAANNKDADAIAVVAKWRKAETNDPVVREIRASVRADLSAWLGTPQMRKKQAELAAQDMAYAYALAQAWRRDMAAARNQPVRPVDARLLTYFYDLKTYNGGIGDLWVKHVIDYRATHTTSALVFADASSWVDLCAAVRKETPQKTLYTVPLTQKNLTLWSAMPPEEAQRLDEDAIDLIVFGLLRAQRSTGPDKPNGFPGVFQVDVFYRRAIEALGYGHLKGERAGAKPVDIYTTTGTSAQ